MPLRCTASIEGILATVDIRYASLLVIAAMACAPTASAHLPGRADSDGLESALAARALVDRFLAAVEREGLTILGVRIGCDRLVPRRVYYLYDLETGESSQEVYADLQPPIPTPGEEDCEIRGLSVKLDTFGAILESSAHVWCE